MRGSLTGIQASVLAILLGTGEDGMHVYAMQKRLFNQPSERAITQAILRLQEKGVVTFVGYRGGRGPLQNVYAITDVAAARALLNEYIKEQHEHLEALFVLVQGISQEI